jgi:hypothetical protein
MQHGAGATAAAAAAAAPAHIFRLVGEHATVNLCDSRQQSVDDNMPTSPNAA